MTEQISRERLIDFAYEIHEEAMSFAERAFLARREGEGEQADSLFRKAFAKEKSAAGLVEGDEHLEPTRSVLHRSAASLAVECGEFNEAKRLAEIGLGGSPPGEIAEELRRVLERCSSLAPDEWPRLPRWILIQVKQFLEEGEGLKNILSYLLLEDLAQGRTNAPAFPVRNIEGEKRNRPLEVRTLNKEREAI